MNKKMQRDISHLSQENIAVKINIAIKFLLSHGTHRHYDIIN